MGQYYEYNYDPVRNRLCQIINGDTTDYLYDAANRLESVNGQPYTFDANGNLLNSDTMTNTWDATNRLTKIVNPKSEIVNRYNGVNDRVGQTIGLSTTHFALDIAAGLPEVIYSSEDETYLHLPGVIVTEKAGETRYLLSDGLGSVRQAVDDNGSVVVYNEFDPYGNPVQNDSSPYGFTGEWWQDDIRLLHLRARWYMPEMGTFLSRDAVESEPPYQYVGGNPILYSDPSGQCRGLTGKALEVCNQAKGWFLKKVTIATTKIEVVINDCEATVANATSKILIRYDANRERVRNWLGIDDKVDQSMPIIPYTNRKIPFVNSAEAAMLELLGEDRAYLGGDALDLVRADPAQMSYEQKLVAQIMNDPRYRKQAFPVKFPPNDDMQYGGDRYRGAPMFPHQFFFPLSSEYRDTLNVGLNDLSWLIRSVTVEANAQVSKSGSIIINYHFEDELDFDPNRSWDTPDGIAYNVISTILRFGWHKGLRATEMKINANWSSSYP